MLFMVCIAIILSAVPSYCHNICNAEIKLGSTLRNQPRIINQLRLKKKELTPQPWNVAVDHILKSGTSFLCGGVLVYPRVIVSSASCFENKITNEIGVRDTKDVLHKVHSLIRHPGFTTNSYYNDIALLILEKPLSNSTVKMLRKYRNLNFESWDEDLEAVPMFWFTQWNSHDFKQLERWRQWDCLPRVIPESRINQDYFITPEIRNVNIMENPECEELLRWSFARVNLSFYTFFPNGIDKTLFCVKLPYNPNIPREESRGHQLLLNYESTLTACPTIDPSPRLYTLIGTRAQATEGHTGSYSTHCSPILSDHGPTIYTNLASFYPWIISTLRYMEYFPIKKRKNRKFVQPSC